MRPPAHLAPPTGQGHKLVTLRDGALILLAATGLGFFFAAQIYFSAAAFQQEVSWGQALFWSFGDWYEWALLSPIVFWTCRTFRFHRGAWPKSVAVHLLGALLLCGLHSTMWFATKAPIT